MTSLARPRLALLAVLACVVALAPVVLAGPASASLAATSTAHPYSDPIWYPLSVGANMDCAKSNPGCPAAARHKDFSVDVVPTGQRPGHSLRALVYAMGAGRVHIQQAHGAACPAKQNTFGTEIDISHGGGVISRYGHLASTFLVKEGQYVAAGQPIGYIGTSGKNKNCYNNYLDFQVRREGAAGPATTLTTLYACLGGKRVKFPEAGTARKYSTWNKVPQSTVIAAPQNPATCMTGRTPATPARPASLTLKKSSSLHLTARWPRPAAADKVTDIRLSLDSFHTSTGKWDFPWNQKWVDLKPTATGYTFSVNRTGAKLMKNHTYRVTLWVRNSSGWSAARGPVSAKAT